MALETLFQCAFLVLVAFALILCNSANPCCASEIAHFGVFELQLELVRNQGDELRIAFWSINWNVSKIAVGCCFQNLVCCVVYGINALVFIKLFLL